MMKVPVIAGWHRTSTDLDTARLRAASRSVEVRCHPAIADTFALLGARDVAGVNLVSADDR